MQTNIIAQAESNLFELYRLAGSSEGVKIGYNDYFTYINVLPCAWPNYMFYNSLTNNSLEVSLYEANKMMLENDAPPFIINGPGIDDSLFEKLATKFKFRKVMQWPGMAKPLLNNNLITSESQVKLEFTYCEVVDIEKLNLWINIVERNLFPKKKLPHSVFLKFLSIPHIKLWLGFYNGIPVSTVLCHELNNIVGIYMVSVLPEFRGKGMAKSIIYHSLKESNNRGCQTAVLQANDNSYQLYKSMGFNDFGAFSIYWRMIE